MRFFRKTNILSPLALRMNSPAQPTRTRKRTVRDWAVREKRVMRDIDLVFDRVLAIKNGTRTPEGLRVNFPTKLGGIDVITLTPTEARGYRISLRHDYYFLARELIRVRKKLYHAHQRQSFNPFYHSKRLLRKFRIWARKRKK